MTSFIAITNYSYKFRENPHCANFHNTLNNTYVQPFESSDVNRFFTDARKTAITANIITIMRSAIIDTILLSSQADITVTAPIVNHMLLFGYFGIPVQKFPIQSPGTVYTALNAALAGNSTTVIIQINTASHFVNCDTFNCMNFDSIYINVSVLHIGGSAGTGTGTGTGAGAGADADADAGAGAGAGAGASPRVVLPNLAVIAAATTTAATATTTATITALAANQAATLLSVFNVQNLPLAVRTYNQNYMDSIFLMTNADIQPFPTPTE